MTRPASAEALQRIAILGGTGKEGPGLATRWAMAGCSIIIGSRQLEKARLTADEINSALRIRSVVGMENSEAARQAEICVLTVEYSAHRTALESLRENLQGKILVDATARVDFRDPRPPEPPSAARTAQQILGPDVRVVAALQNVPAHVLRKNLDEPLDSDVLVCADHLEAAKKVIGIIEMLGVRAYYAGSLDNALVVEGLTAVLISLNKYYKVKTAAISVTGIISH